jgi:hypothetical protein
MTSLLISIWFAVMSSVGAISSPCLDSVACAAQELKGFGKVVLDCPSVDSLPTTDLFSVGSAVTVDMVKFKSIQVRLTAADALASIAEERFLADNSLLCCVLDSACLADQEAIYCFSSAKQTRADRTASCSFRLMTSQTSLATSAIRGWRSAASSTASFQFDFVPFGSVAGGDFFGGFGFVVCSVEAALFRETRLASKQPITQGASAFGAESGNSSFESSRSVSFACFDRITIRHADPLSGLVCLGGGVRVPAQTHRRHFTATVLTGKGQEVAN